jgi:hypothetical protein
VACASSGDAHNRPRANQRITALGCFSRRRSKVGRSSSCRAARNAVGSSSMMIVQYA